MHKKVLKLQAYNTQCLARILAEATGSIKDLQVRTLRASSSTLKFGVIKHQRTTASLTHATEIHTNVFCASHNSTGGSGGTAPLIRNQVDVSGQLHTPAA